MKLLHTPVSVGQNLDLLISAEKKAGIESEAYIFNKHPFDHPKIKYLGKPVKKVGPFNDLRPIHKLNLYKRSKMYDILFFHYGRTILDWPYLGLPAIDYKLYRDKFVVSYFRGLADLAPLYFYKKFGATGFLLEKIYNISGLMRTKVRRVAKASDLIFYSTPNLKEYLEYFAQDLIKDKPIIHLPVFLNVDKKSKVKKTKKDILILHTPTNQKLKGTKYVREAIKKIKSDGLKIKYIEATNLSSQEVEILYAKCDIFIDQLIIGWYGASAVKAIKYNKLTVCYIDKNYIKHSKIKALPIVNADRKTLYRVLKDVISNPSKYKPKKDIVNKFLKRHSCNNLYENAIKYYKKNLLILCP